MSSTLIEFILLFFFFNDTATTEIYTLSLHDALPISRCALSHGLSLRDESNLKVPVRRLVLLFPDDEIGLFPQLGATSYALARTLRSARNVDQSFLARSVSGLSRMKTWRGVAWSSRRR